MQIINWFLSLLVSINSFHWAAWDNWWINKLLNCCSWDQCALSVCDGSPLHVDSRVTVCLTAVCAAGAVCSCIVKINLKACRGFSGELIWIIISLWNNNLHPRQVEPLWSVLGVNFRWSNLCCYVLFAEIFLSVTDELPLVSLEFFFFVSRKTFDGSDFSVVWIKRQS